MKNTIRRFMLEDLAEVIQLSALLPEWFDEDACSRAIPIDLQFQEVFVCEGMVSKSASDKGPAVERQILGFIALFVSEGRVNIGWMGVHPDFRRQGIGGMLIQAAEAFCRSVGIEQLATYTLGDGVYYPPYDSTRAFYKKHGFSVYQRSQTDNPGCPEEIKLKKWV